MSTAIGNLLRSTSTKKSLNIISFPTHERYQSNLGLTNHTFYLFHANGIKTWNDTYAPLPANHIRLNPEKGLGQIPNHIEFDLILSQNKFGQFQVAQELSIMMSLPIASIEHTLPVPYWPPDYINDVKKMKGKTNAFISEFSRREWWWSPEEADVIHHGINTEIFSFNPKQENRRGVVLSVCNDWINRDVFCGFKVWEKASVGLPVFVLGDTPGLSKPANSLEDLVLAYQTSAVFLNTSQVSPIPTSLLEAMACGACPVSSATCMIPEIIVNGENGFLSNNPDELNDYCNLLLKDEKLREKISHNAAKTIREKFSHYKFIENWEKLFRKTIL